LAVLIIFGTVGVCGIGRRYGIPAESRLRRRNREPAVRDFTRESLLGDIGQLGRILGEVEKFAVAHLAVVFGDAQEFCGGTEIVHGRGNDI
jgi:hypothetical protein